MRRFLALLKRLLAPFSKDRAERELVEELETNLQLHIDDNIRSGMSEEEALRHARLKVGSVDALKEAWRDRRGIPFLEFLFRDIRYGLGMLARQKSWTAIAILSLALGVGVNAALYSVARNVALRTLDVENPDELVALRWIGSLENLRVTGTYGYGHVAEGSDDTPKGLAFAVFQFEQFRLGNSTLTDVFGFAPSFSLNVIRNGEPVVARAQFVSGNLFSALGAVPVQGRLLEPADDERSAAPVVVISRRFWEQRFGRSPSVLGSALIINGISFKIVGVHPDEAGQLTRIGSGPHDLSIPLSMVPHLGNRLPSIDNRSDWWLIVMGRRRPGVTIQQVQANLEPIFDQAVRQDTVSRKGAAVPPVPRLKVAPGSRGAADMTPQHSQTLWILTLVFGSVLLIVCVNLANLLLARATTRQKEIAVRVAIGATRGRVIQQLLTESILLSLFGGVAALFVASVSREFFPPSLGVQPQLDWSAFAFASIASVVVGTLFGLAPVIRLRPTLRDAINSFPESRSRFAKSLVIVQIAMSLMLIVGAGLFLRTLQNLKAVDLGYDPSHLLTLSLSANDDRPGARRLESLYEEVVARLSTVPDVESATVSSRPLTGGWAARYSLYTPGQEASADADQMVVRYNFFETMGIPTQLGRTFTEQDGLGAVPVVIINESLARAFFSGSSPLGKFVSQSKGPGSTQMQIVGVVADVRDSKVRNKPTPLFYLPAAQRRGRESLLTIRTRGEPASLVPAVRTLVKGIDSRLGIEKLSTHVTAIEEANWREERAYAWTSTFFGALTLVIAMIGLFGLMSYTVTRRTRAIGIRMVLGAQRRRILISFVRQSMTLVVIGVVAGLAASTAMAPLIKSLLFEIAPDDGTTVVASVLVILVVSLVAGWLPARRASSIDPLSATRQE